MAEKNSSGELIIRCRSSTSADFTEDEVEVAGILLQLPKLILARELQSRLTFGWGSKRRRSVLNDNNENDNNHNRNDNRASSPLRVGTSGVGPKAEEEGAVVTAKGEASSPATPLSFSPSESDEKPKALRRKVHVKRKREEWLEIIKELTERRELLKREKETVSRYFDKLKAFNLELKARRVELTRGIKRETPNLVIGQNLSVVMESGQPNVSSSSTTDSQEVHHQPLIINRTAQVAGIRENIQYSGSHVVSSSGFNNNYNNKNVIPDLNISAEESYRMECFQPLDLAMANKNLSRVTATEARRRRIQIYRAKNSIAANKLRYPCA